MKHMKYRVILSHHPNIDIDYRGGYWGEVKDVNNMVGYADTLSELRDMFIDWRERNELGGGNVNSAEVFDNNGKNVGRFSYNGRFWRTSYRSEVK